MKVDDLVKERQRLVARRTAIKREAKQATQQINILNKVIAVYGGAEELAAESTNGKAHEIREGGRVQRMGVLWDWFDDGYLHCLVKGCDATAKTSSSIGGHFQRRHPDQFAANSLDA